jgi:hypothetical protein
MGMSAITIAEAITNSKSPRQQKAAIGKTLFPFRLREIIIHEQFEDREKTYLMRGAETIIASFQSICERDNITFLLFISRMNVIYLSSFMSLLFLTQ